MLANSIARNRLIITFALICLMVQSVNAGTKGKIAGHVIDASTNEPLIGANVLVEGTSLGATTDLEVIILFSIFRRVATSCNRNTSAIRA
jgi:hypothetical protein